MRCYVCLDDCDTRSPCTCGAPVHEKCLARLRDHYRFHHFRDECSICKSRLRVHSDYFGVLLLLLFIWFVVYGDGVSKND